MIDFQSRNKPAYAHTIGRMAVSDDDDLRRVKTEEGDWAMNSYLMTSADEGSAEHIDVILDSPNFWVKKVGDHAGC